MVFQPISVTFCPTQGETVGFYQAPAFLLPGEHIAVHIFADLFAACGEGAAAAAVCLSLPDGAADLQGGLPCHHPGDLFGKLDVVLNE